MGFREFFDEARYSLWEAGDTLRHRRREAKRKRKGRMSSEPSALSAFIGDFTRPNTSLRDKLRIRRAAMPHRKAWKRYLEGQAQAERMWGPQSRLPTQPLERSER